MLTKGAIGNLINRYKAVLKKCNLINSFGSLAVASMLVLGGAGEAGAVGKIGEYWGNSSVQANDQGNYESGFVGGWFNRLTDAKDVEVTFENVTGDIIVGGNFGKHEDSSWHQDIGMQTIPDGMSGVSTDNIIKGDGTAINTVIGGNHIVIAAVTGQERDINFENHTTKLTIEGGTFGNKQGGTQPCPEFFVIAGDVIKANVHQHHAGCTTDADSKIASTNLTISGGTFNAPVLGGSGALEWYGGNKNGLTAHVEKANVTITGGEFLDPIFAGGLSFHHTTYAEDSAVTKSTVGEATLTIDGSSDEKLTVGDVYAGGLQFEGYVQKHVNEDGATVGNAHVDHASISIKNASVKNIYGSEGLLYNDKDGGGNHFFGADGEYDYSPNAEAYAAVKTDLTLTDASAEKVVLNHVDSSLKLGGKASIADLAFAGTDITIVDSEKNKADVTIGTSTDAFLKDVNIAMTEGQKLQLDSTAAIVGNVKGLFTGNSSITGRGDIVVTHLEGNYGTIVGQDSNVTLQGDSITLTGKGKYPVVYNAGSTGWNHELNANADLDTAGTKDNDITIIGQSGSQAVNAQSNGITIRNFDTLTLKNEGDKADDGYAISSTGDGVLTIKEGKNVDVASSGRGALYNTSTLSIDADEISVSAVIGDQSEAHKQSAVYVTDGTLGVTAKDKLTIKAEGTADASKFYAIGVTGGTVELTGGAESSITGNVQLTGGTTTIDMGEGSKIDGRVQVASGAEATIKGDITFADQANSSDNPFPVIQNKGKLTVNGATFSNNKATINGGTIYGGAIASWEAETTLTDVTFSGNTTSTDDGQNGSGGGLYARNGKVTVTGGTFENNYSGKMGGAVYLASSENSKGEAHFTDVEFIGNKSRTAGAAVVLNGNNPNNYKATFDNVRFENNIAGGDSGAVYVCGTEASFKDTTFTGNLSTEGGAIRNWSIVNFDGINTFSDNTANEKSNDIYSSGIINVTGGTTTLNSGYAQAAGAVTNIKGGTFAVYGDLDIVGSTVVVEGGTFIANASEVLDLESDFAALEGLGTAVSGVTGDVKLDLGTKNADGTITAGEYTLSQYDKAAGTLFTDGEKAELSFLNAVVKAEKEDSLLIGADVNDNTATLGSDSVPTLVQKGDSVDDTPDSVAHPELYYNNKVTVAPSDDKDHKAAKVDKIHAMDSEFDAGILVVGEGSGKDGVVELVINGSEGVGSDVTMSGYHKADHEGDDEHGIIMDENGKVLDVKVVVEEGSKFTFGHHDNTDLEQSAKIKEADIKGHHVVDGNGAHNTHIDYEKVAMGGKGQMHFLDTAARIDKLDAKGGRIYIDPAYVNIHTVEGSMGAELVVGSGSVVEFGAPSDELESIVKDEMQIPVRESASGFTVDDGKAVLSLLGMPEGLSLGATGALVVDGAITDPAHPVTPNSAVFGEDSLLVVDGANVAEKAAIKGSGTGTITVAEGAELYIRDAKADQHYTIAEGFDNTNSNVEGWKDVISNALTAAHAKYDAATGEVVISIEQKDAAEFMPGVIPTNALNTMMTENINSVADEAPAAIKFLSRAVEAPKAGYTSGLEEGIALINEVSRAAVTAGVQNTALRITDAASNTVLDHMSLASNTASVHSNGADFWAAPMYGNLYTSGMNVAGNSVRGQFGGLALGADLEGGNFLGGKFRIGAAINGGGGQSETKGTATYTENDYDFGGVNVYAGWNKGALNIIGSLGYGFGNNDVEMGLPSSMGMGTAKADIDTSMFTADLRAEYQLKTDWVDVLPHAGIRYTALKTDAHDLKVGGAVLNSVQSDTQNIVQFPIGVTLSKDFDLAGWTVKPSADVSVIPAAGDKKATTKVNFSGLDAWDSVNTRVMDSTSWAGTIGVQAEKGNMTFGLNYGVQASSNETDQNIQVKFGWKF